MDIDAIVETEKKLLSALMLKNGIGIPSVAEQLKPDDFYRAEHREIYAALLSMNDSGQGVNTLLVEDELKRRGTFDNVTRSYLYSLDPLEYTTLRIPYYVPIIKEASIRRKLITLGKRITSMAEDERNDVAAILKTLDEQLTTATESTTRREVKSKTELFAEVYKSFSDKTHVTGLSTGYLCVDDLIGGLRRSDLIILAARPAMGKTALALNIANNVARSNSVLMFSLEMAQRQLAERLFAADSRVNSLRIQNHAAFTDDEMTALTNSIDHADAFKLYIDDTSGISLTEMKIKARNVKHEHGLDLIVVDYLQLMTGSRAYRGDRVQEVSEISRGLKALAKDLDVPVLALSQLSRGVESRADKRPMLSDLRESGSIEQDADIVIFLYRDDYYDKNSDRAGYAEVLVAKNRNGAVGNTVLRFEREYQLFSMITRKDF